MDIVICENCTKPMEAVDELSWICQPCKRNVYWFQTEHVAEPTRSFLQREWE